MRLEQILKTAGIVVASVLGIIALISMLVIFNSDSSPEDKITGLVMLMIPTEVGIMKSLAGIGGIFGAILIIVVIWFFANYVNNH